MWKCDKAIRRGLLWIWIFWKLTRNLTRETLMTPLLAVFTYSRQNFLCQSWEHFRRTYRDYWANFSMFNIGKCDWIKSIKRAKSTWNIHKSRNNPGSKLRDTKLTVNINIDLMTHLREVGTMCLSPSSAWALASSGTRLLSEVSTPEPEPGGWNMTTVRGEDKMWNEMTYGCWVFDELFSKLNSIISIENHVNVSVLVFCVNLNVCM